MHSFKIKIFALLVIVGLNSFAFSQQVEGLRKNSSKPTPYPTAALKRPFTMPKNSFESTLNLKVGAHNGSKAFYSLDYLALTYGITDDVQIGLSWNGFTVESLSKGQFKTANAIDLSVGYFLYAVPYVAAMASLSIPFHFDREVIKTTSFAMPTSFSIIPSKLSVLAFYRDFIVMNWRADTSANKPAYTVDFNFPLQLSYQVTNSFYASLSTDIGSISTDGSFSHIGEVTPLSLFGLYAINSSFDITGQAKFDDVQSWKETFSFIAAVNYRFGKING